MKPQRLRALVLGLLVGVSVVGSAVKTRAAVDGNGSGAGQTERTGKGPKSGPAATAERDTARESTDYRRAGNDPRPAKPDSAVIAAWEQAGAEFVLEPSTDGIPTFRFTQVVSGVSEKLRGLPQPGIPFAVNCFYADDAALATMSRRRKRNSQNCVGFIVRRSFVQVHF